jgi:hypothetical protein
LIIGLVIAAGVLVVAILVVVIVVVAEGDSGRTTASPRSPAPGSGGGGAAAQLTPKEYDDNPSWSLWDPLNDRTADSGALTVDEVFGASESRSTEDSAKRVYTLQGSGRLDVDCAQAVWGEQLKAQLRGYGCTQVVRGVYADASRRSMGHAAVFNLRDVASANQFIKDLDPTLGKGFVVPLPGQPAPMDRFGTGYTGADAGAYGHLVVVSWMGYTDGTNGSSASIDSIPARSAMERGAKNFLFDRLTKAR